MKENQATKNRLSLKIKSLFILSRIVNLTFKSLPNRIIAIFILISLPLFSMIKSIVTLLTYDLAPNIAVTFMLTLNGTFLIAMIVYPLLFGLNFKRVSENFNLDRMTGTLNMSLNNPSDYWKYSYRNNRKEISERLKEEFIKGIIKGSTYRKKLKMSTHKWMIKEVVNSKEIQSRFDIKIIENQKPTKIYTEVLILFSKAEFKEDPIYAYEIAMRERESFTVILNRK